MIADEYWGSSHFVCMSVCFKAWISLCVCICVYVCSFVQVVNGNKEKQKDHLASDSDLALEPAVPKDFQVFINLVDLCRYGLIINAFVLIGN